MNAGEGAKANPPIAWAKAPGLTPYPAAVAAMEALAARIAEGEDGEAVWLVEHPALYTAGVSARAHDLLAPGRMPVFQTGRGGQYTYHGPGQRVAYVMLDLRKRGRDVGCFVADLERWLIAALARFNVEAFTRKGRVGVWVERAREKPARAGRPVEGPQEDKIAAIGVRLRRWVSFHGVALNVDPDLSHYSGIRPCGISASAYGVTSLVDLGLPVSMDEADAALESAFEEVFGPVYKAPPLRLIGESAAIASQSDTHHMTRGGTIEAE